jgi:hypothetical protein
LQSRGSSWLAEVHQIALRVVRDGLRQIETALAEINVVGDRYPAQLAALVGR